MTGLELAKAVVKALDNKLGVDIKILKVEDLTIIADYFVIVSGESATQVQALAGEVEHSVGLLGVKPSAVEGEPNAGWVLLDYSTVIVHVFHSKIREFYSLERLWADAKSVDTEL